ncbi:hypothetical protein ALI22I_20035 [Saccharothrix sp. ALI-22-I]|uniref:hypothetical protein n=1 Tax=Saccharothrix sp. ALI-22-I TaxID=1933778 RepID=UPI00097C2F21|nr:hypothetical protein [Saccharothrix sp. ALI-22-I]ONI88037.1 hypothetical protein ALI22I_20035 [Saccharothrix sp. ALI-22-I]
MGEDEDPFPIPPPEEDGFGGGKDWDALLDQVRPEESDIPGAAHTAAVLGAVVRHPRAVESPEFIEVNLAVLQVLADRSGATGVTVAEIYQRLSDRWPAAAVRDAVLWLALARTITRTKVDRPQLLPRQSMAVALELSPTLNDIRGNHRLLEMFDQLRTEADSGAADKYLLAMLVRLRRQMSIYTFHARSAFRDGDIQSIPAHIDVDETEFKRRFKQASEAVVDHLALVNGLAALNTAVYDYVDAQGYWVTRLLAGQPMADPLDELMRQPWPGTR